MVRIKAEKAGEGGLRLLERRFQARRIRKRGSIWRGLRHEFAQGRQLADVEAGRVGRRKRFRLGHGRQVKAEADVADADFVAVFQRRRSGDAIAVQECAVGGLPTLRMIQRPST